MPAIAALLFFAGALQAQEYKKAVFYLSAHQDDWQLFMGSDVYNDIVDFEEKQNRSNGTKVVIIYTTAGNVNDTDDTKSCDCRDPYSTDDKKYPYWRVREAGAKNSIHLAAARVGGWGSCAPYPKNRTVIINGHEVLRYRYKNTVSYFLRINTGSFNHWSISNLSPAYTVDSSTVYANRFDFINTLYYIFKSELDSTVENKQAVFGFPDFNNDYNPNDHTHHTITGRAAFEAVNLLKADANLCYDEKLYVDYETRNMPANAENTDLANESALISNYCLALLDYNAWPEWGSKFQVWASRNYYRTINSCHNEEHVLDAGGTCRALLYPNPANKQLNISLAKPPLHSLRLQVVDVASHLVIDQNIALMQTNTALDVSSLATGTYVLQVSADGEVPYSLPFEVIH